MSSESDDSIFLTQSKLKENNNPSNDTDGVLSDILDMELLKGPNAQPDFTLKSDIFSDISDDEMIKISQEMDKVEKRFHAPLQEYQLNKLIDNEKCKNTENKSKWAVKVFETRRIQRSSTSNTFPTELVKMTKEDLNSALSFFVAEVKNQAGKEYRPNTIYEIIVAIQHYLRQNGHFVNIFDDTEFSKLRQIMDAKMKSLAKEGRGIQRKQADVITLEQENQLWKENILGTNTPQKLLDTLIYVLGLNFALCAGQEHRNLRFGDNGQISVKVDHNGNRYLEYEEDVSKTNAGGLLHRKISPKVTRAYENSKQPERCPVKIYERYISLRPENSKTNALYLRPAKNISNTCWYSDIPVGVHTLQQTVGKLCKEAGFNGYYTNHSLRAAAATRLYNAGLDEQLVSEKNGHRSVAIRSYQRTSDSQLVNVSKIVQGNSNDAPACKKPSLEISDENIKREITVCSDNMSFSLKF